MRAAVRAVRRLSVCQWSGSPVPYGQALELQHALMSKRRSGEIGDTLIVLEHAPVYTVGKRGQLSDFLEPSALFDADIFTIPRGGETTFHGPGQVVLYPIISLREAGLGARAFVEGLEDTMIRVLGAHGIAAKGRQKCRTGVWVGSRKVGAVGVRISHGVSSHGLALNVAPELARYERIMACGLASGSTDSMAGLLGSAPNVRRVARECVAAFAHTFSYSSVEEGPSVEAAVETHVRLGNGLLLDER